MGGKQNEENRDEQTDKDCIEKFIYGTGNFWENLLVCGASGEVFGGDQDETSAQDSGTSRCV